MTEKKKILLAEIDYRQWLIGQVLPATYRENTASITDAVIDAINCADAVLDKLEEKHGVAPAARIVTFQKAGQVQCSSCSRKYDVGNGQSDQWKLHYRAEGFDGIYFWAHKHAEGWHEAIEVKQ